MLIPQDPPHFPIHTLFSKAFIYSIIIFDLYGPYCNFLQQNGFVFPVFMDDSYLIFMHFVPSLQKRSQYFFTIQINCFFISGVALILNLVCLCSYLLCSSSLNAIKLLRFHYSHVRLGLYNEFLYCWNSNTPLSMSFA